jgi:hypothetical protein
MKNIILLLCLIPGLAFADDLQVYKNSEAHYSVSIPTTWIRRNQKIPDHLNAIEIISPRHEGSLLIMTAKKGVNCKEVLTKFEKDRKLTNLLKPTEQAVMAADLQKAHAQEGLRGRYEFPVAANTQPIEQRALCLRQGSQKQILLGTFRKKNGPDLLEAILKSFSFNN